jgi:hypothetical protein
MPHAYQIINCEKCGTEFCRICKTHCPKCKMAYLPPNEKERLFIEQYRSAYKNQTQKSKR